MAKKPVRLANGKEWPSRGDAISYFRELRDRHPIGAPILDRSDHDDLLALLERYDLAITDGSGKIGAGVDHFETRVNVTSGGRSIGFWAVRVDDTETDFSFIRAVNETPKRELEQLADDRGLAEEGIEDLYVGGNNPQYGVIAAKYFKNRFPEGAKIVVMRGIPTTIDNIRIEAFQKELEGTKIEILDMQFANWNPDKGFEVMQDFLQKFETVDAVWAGDDDAALGAMEAINQAKRQKPIAVLGGSGMNKVIKMVQDGGSMVDADIFYPPTLIVPAIELTAMRAATQAPIRGRYILDSPLITKDNAAEFYFTDAPY